MDVSLYKTFDYNSWMALKLDLELSQIGDIPIRLETAGIKLVCLRNLIDT